MESSKFTSEQLENLAIICKTYSEYMKKGDMNHDQQNRVSLAELLIEAIHYGKVDLSYEFSEPTEEDFKSLEYRIS